VSETTRLSQAACDAALDASLALANGGKITIYDGAQPESPDAPVTTQNELVTLGLESPAAEPTAGGTATMNAVTQGTAAATGTASWFRVYSSAGAPVWDGSVGDGAADLNFPSTAFVAGSQYGISGWTVSRPPSH